MQKTRWTCEHCVLNYVCESLKSLKLHSRRSHKIVALHKNATIANDATLNNRNVDSIADNRYFLDLQKEEKWIAFHNNLNYLKKEDRKFIIAPHKNKANKFLVAHS